MKNKINILIPIFIVLVLIYVIRSVAGTRVQVEVLLEGSMEDIVSTKAVLIKKETVLNPTIDGVSEPLVSDGTRVAAGQAVAAVYSATVDPELRNRLEQIKKKLALLDAGQTNLLSYTGDVSHLEKKISEQTAKMIEKSREGDMAAVSELQFIIEVLCEKKAQLSGNSTGGGTLEALTAEKQQLEAQIGAAHHQITAPVSGEFTTTIDGFEGELMPENLETLTPSVLQSFLDRDRGQEVKAEADACKIVDNFRYHVALNLPADRVNTLHVGNTAKLRLYELSGNLVSGKIVFISAEENGEHTVILECDRYIASLLKRRFVNVEFIKNRYEGYRVSVKSLHTKGDETGVYVRRDDVLKFIPVTILYNSQDVAIVDSASAENPLRLYDEVVVSASSYEEGKLLR